MTAKDPTRPDGVRKLYELMRRVNSSSDPHEVLEEIARGVVEVLGFGVAAISRLEGDTLVIDTIGLSSKTTFDMLGAPHTDQLHLVERIRLLNPNEFEDLITIDDPGTFSHPWTERATYKRTDHEIMEYICLDGNRNKVVGGMVTIDGKPRDAKGAAAKKK